MSTCAECKHYLAAGEGATAGICRRFPPQLLVTAEEVRGETPEDPPVKPFGWATRFPVVMADWLCGEWAVRPEQEN